MTQDPTIIVSFVLDNSGSMYGRRDETITSANLYLKDRINESRNDIHLILHLFAGPDELKLLHDGKVEDFKDLNQESYSASGSSTALLDAIASAIDITKKRAEAMKNKPHVLFVVLTDGHENSSRKYNHSQIAEIVKAREAEDNWTIVFLGADLDAWNQAERMGIKTAAAYNANNMTGTMRSLSDSTSNYYNVVSSGDINSHEFFDNNKSILGNE